MGWELGDAGALIAAQVAVLSLLAANAAAAHRIYGGAESARTKRLWLAAIWGLPLLGLALWAVSRLRSERHARSAVYGSVDSAR